MKDLILLRGLPGSGKSTFAKMLVRDKDYRHKEADMFFVDSEGNYKFEPSKIQISRLSMPYTLESVLDQQLLFINPRP